MPTEWRFSDAEAGPPTEVEDALGEILSDPKSEREAAAALLWRNRSFIHAKAAMDLSERTGGALRTQIEAGLTLEVLKRELQSDDPSWGLWLAYLRPRPELVEELLQVVQRPGLFQAGAAVALGRSGDRRALEPLIAHLKGGDRVLSGFAARALGDLRLAEAETELIGALSASENPWLQARACEALARIGTERALPALREVAKDPRKQGVINTERSAARAIVEIESRFAERKGKFKPSR